MVRFFAAHDMPAFYGDQLVDFPARKRMMSIDGIALSLDSPRLPVEFESPAS